MLENSYTRYECDVIKPDSPIIFSPSPQENQLNCITIQRWGDRQASPVLSFPCPPSFLCSHGSVLRLHLEFSWLVSFSELNCTVPVSTSVFSFWISYACPNPFLHTLYFPSAWATSPLFFLWVSCPLLVSLCMTGLMGLVLFSKCLCSTASVLCELQLKFLFFFFFREAV